MDKKIQQLINDTREGFEKYLIENKKTELLSQINELFDFRVEKVPHLLNISLKFKDDLIFNESISLNEFDDIPNKVKQSIRMIRNDELVTHFNISFNDKMVFDENLSIKNINQLDSILEDRKSDIYQKIGKIDISMVHNKSNELLGFKINYADFYRLPEIMKEYERLVFDKYIYDKKVRHDDGHWHGGGGVPAGPIPLFGNFIVDEFDNFLSDENGNCIIF
jgi:hypothetical protein